MGLYNMGHHSGLTHTMPTVPTGMFNVVPALSQRSTNGLSDYGTLNARRLPSYLTNNPLPDGKPWGSKTDTHTNVYTDAADTGVARNYDFTITRAQISPDGYQMNNMFLVNGQFPGPLIEANWGDQIVVTVHNNITEDPEGFSMHWHGFLQSDTPWMDGVPGVTECPIVPGQSYTYSFNASMYGSTWYHSHYSAQYSSGVVGPMVIYGPSSATDANVIDVGPVMLSDWYHTEYWKILDEMLSPGASPLVYSVNNLINGKMNFDCSTVKSGDTTPCVSNAGISKFQFQTNKTHRLRLVNSGSEGVQRFSIDNHIMTVIANDFVPVQPYNTTVVTLGVGQRSDVLVTANAGGPESSFWMRSNITSCSLTNQPYAVAAVYYDQANTNSTPSSKSWDVSDPGTCTNDDLSTTIPLYAIPVTTPNTTKVMDVNIYTNGSNVDLWKFDNVSNRVDYNNPVLPMANQGNFSFPEATNVINFAGNQSIRILVNNSSPSSHPMHLHGHNYQVLAEGPGNWDGTIVRPDNPQRRDTQMVRANGHMLLQFDGNPGVWVFHCHIAWHASAGFLAIFLINPNNAVQNMQIPSPVTDTCSSWGTYSSGYKVDQIDSGD